MESQSPLDTEEGKVKYIDYFEAIFLKCSIITFDKVKSSSPPPFYHPRPAKTVEFGHRSGDTTT